MAAVKLLNTFLLGADPEMVMLDPPNIVNGMGRERTVDKSGYYGWDHGGFVIEPHPLPDHSARNVCKNIKAALDYVYFKFDNVKFRAGAHINSPQRMVTLGGHVHLDLPTLAPNQVAAMDALKLSFESLDILPAAECRRRNEHEYGRLGNIRAEHGHVEYRSFCSWLFSRKTTMLVLTATKLAAVDPTSLPVRGFTSTVQVRNWMERYKEGDDDVRWILDQDYFGRSLEARPDSSVMRIWRADPENGEALHNATVERLTALKKQQAQERARIQQVNPPVVNVNWVVGQPIRNNF